MIERAVKNREYYLTKIKEIEEFAATATSPGNIRDLATVIRGYRALLARSRPSPITAAWSGAYKCIRDEVENSSTVRASVGHYDMTQNVKLAIQLRNKSEEVKVIAEDMRSEKAKEFLMGVAADYLEMADTVEHMPTQSDWTTAAQ